MVRSVLALGLWMTAGTCAAQGIDWRPAGGGLFPGEAVAHMSDPVPSGAADDQTPQDGLPVLDALSQPYMAAIAAAAQRHGLDPKLLHALVVTESAYRPDVCSHAGACGLAQLMPGTARDLGVRDRFDPVENLHGGADYLARQLLRFGDVRLALAAYNAGPARVARLGRVPDIAETRDYVATVVDCYLALTAGRGIRSSRDCRATGDGR